MPFLINPYIYAGAAPYENDYSMQFIRTTTVANIERLYINNKSNTVDTALRDTTPQFTVSQWVKLDAASASQNRRLFTKADYASVDKCIQFNVNNTNKIVVYGTYDNTNTTVLKVTSASYTDADGWIHVAFVYDSTQTVAADIAKLYVNGSVVALATDIVNTTQKYFYNQATEGNRAYVTLGCTYATTPGTPENSALGGRMDEVSFWDTPLSSGDITTIYNGGGPTTDLSEISSYDTNCLAWWRMGDYTGDNWDGSKWNIDNAVGSTTEDMISANLVEADRVADVP